MNINWKKLRNNIPSKIKVGRNSFYEIVWINGFHSDKEGEGTTYGEARPDIKQIVLNNEQSDKESVLTFVHEWFHAINFEHEIGITEKQVTKFENNFKYLNELIKTLNGFE